MASTSHSRPSTSSAPQPQTQEAPALPMKRGELGYPFIISVPSTPEPAAPPPPAAPSTPLPSNSRCASLNRARSFRKRHAVSLASTALAISLGLLIATAAGYGFCLRILVEAHRAATHRRMDNVIQVNVNASSSATPHRRGLEMGRARSGIWDTVGDLERKSMNERDRTLPVRVSAKRFHRQRRRRPTATLDKRQAPPVVDILRASSSHSSRSLASTRSEPVSIASSTSLPLPTTYTPSSSAASQNQNSSSTSSPQQQSQDDSNDPSSPIFVHALFILAILSELVLIWKASKKLWWAVAERRIERTKAAREQERAQEQEMEQVDHGAVGANGGVAPHGAGAGTGQEADEGESMHPVELAEQRRQQQQRRSPTPNRARPKPEPESTLTKWLNILFGTPPQPTAVPPPRLPTYNAALGFSSDGRRRLRGRRWRDGAERGTGDGEDLEVERNRRGGAPPAYNSDELRQSHLLLSGPAIRRALSVLSARFSASTNASMHTAQAHPQGTTSPDALLSPASSVRASVASFVGLVRRISLLGVGPSSSAVGSTAGTPRVERERPILEEEEGEKRESGISLGRRGGREEVRERGRTTVGVISRGKGKEVRRGENDDAASDAGSDDSYADKATISGRFAVVAHSPERSRSPDAQSVTTIRGVGIGSSMAARMSQRLQLQRSGSSSSSVASSFGRRGRPPSLDLSSSRGIGAGSRTRPVEVVAVNGGLSEEDEEQEAEEMREVRSPSERRREKEGVV